YARTVVSADPSARTKLLGNKYMKLGALGAGSDWGGFLQHLGIASINIGFGGESKGNQYHSIYDSYDHFTKYIDPGFQYGVTLSKTTGRTLMRLANADVLPVDFSSFYKTVNDYTTEIKGQLEKMRTETEDETKMLKDKLYDLAKDPTETYGPPQAKDIVPYLDWSKLENALVQLKSASDEFQKLYASATKLASDKQAELNVILYKAERSLLQEKGLPRREWYRHQIYAPGFYTGYGVKTIPGIREAVEQRFWKEAQDNIAIVAQTLQNYTEQVNAANALMK
ncbi:MAG: folate hydrolase, partial [Bacteroidetes bacterium]|nr:folate hydrolase [Bacteroidota bacterium]